MKDFIQALKFGSREKKLLVALVATSLIISGLNAVAPLFLKIVFDLVDKNLRARVYTVDLVFFAKIILLWFGVQVLSTVFSEWNRQLSEIWWTKTWNNLLEKGLKHTQELSLSYFESTSTGKILERFFQGASDTVGITSSFFTTILPQIFFIIIAFILLLKINYIFALIILIGAPIYMAIIKFYRKKFKAIQTEVRIKVEENRGFATETVANIKTVKTYSKETDHLKHFKKSLNNILTLSVQRTIIRIKMGLMRGFVVDISQTLVLFIGLYWTLTGKLTLGSFILAWTYTNQAFSPLRMIVARIDDIQRDLVSVSLLKEFFDIEPEINDKEGAITLKNIQGGIDLENLSFSYDGEKDTAIKDISLKIEKGKVVAFVGRSGVGKSTLIKLLLRFYDPQKGRIIIDGIDIKNVTQKSLRENIGVVMQDSVIFNDTVINNIGYGKNNASKNEIIKAARMANADDFIQKLPKGYNTIVGERGVKLSGGEQQRINIARAFLKNAPILILDEATSNLDSESELLIQDALWKLIKGKTTIIIAHRLSTVMRADEIIVLDNGRIVEKDAHANLVTKKGIYSRLFKIQSGGYLK